MDFWSFFSSFWHVCALIHLSNFFCQWLFVGAIVTFLWFNVGFVTVFSFNCSEGWYEIFWWKRKDAESEMDIVKFWGEYWMELVNFFLTKLTWRKTAIKGSKTAIKGCKTVIKRCKTVIKRCETVIKNFNKHLIQTLSNYPFHLHINIFISVFSVPFYNVFFL